MAECLNCKTDFTPKRKNALFCSDKCRVQNHQQNKSAPASAAKPEIGFMGFGNPGKSNQMSMSGNPAFDYLLQNVQHENFALKNENVLLKNANDKLKDDLRDMKLEAATKDKLAEAEKIADSSKGLGGVFDKVTSSDRFMGLLEKVALNYVGAKDSDDEENLGDLLGEHKDLMMEIVKLLKDQDETFVALYFKLTQFYTAHPDLLQKAVNAIKAAKKVINQEEPQQQ
jgi:hypothetical protein